MNERVRAQLGSALRRRFAADVAVRTTHAWLVLPAGHAQAGLYDVVYNDRARAFFASLLDRVADFNGARRDRFAAALRTGGQAAQV